MQQAYTQPITPLNAPNPIAAASEPSPRQARPTGEPEVAHWIRSPTGAPSTSTQAWAEKGFARTPVHHVCHVPRTRHRRAVATERCRHACPAHRRLTATTAARAAAAWSAVAGATRQRVNSSTARSLDGKSLLRIPATNTTKRGTTWRYGRGSGDTGSPRSSGSTSASSAGRSPESSSLAFFRPPPVRRTRTNGPWPDSSSATGRETVPSRTPAARETSLIPQCPGDRASAPIASRR